MAEKSVERQARELLDRVGDASAYQHPTSALAELMRLIESQTPSAPAPVPEIVPPAPVVTEAPAPDADES